MKIPLRLLAIVLAALGISGLALAQTRPAAAEMALPTDPELLKQYRAQTQFSMRLKLEPKYHSVSDLIQSKIEDGAISLTAKVDVSNQQVRVELDDLPGITMVSSNRGGNGYVQLTNIMPSESGYTTMHISGSMGSVNISINEITKASQGSISFNQNVARMAGQNSVQFSIYRSDPRGGAVREQKNYTGATLEDMRRRHPAAEDELRKLLHRLAQDHLLAADPRLAWQVFAEDLPPKPEMVQQVAGLVKLLDADDSKVRDEAVTKLRSLGAPGMLAMVRVDRKGLSLEQQFRLDSAIEPYKSMTDDLAKSRRGDTMFLLDCLICADPLVPPLALVRLKEVTGKKFDFKTDAPLDDRIKASIAIREEVAKSAATRPGK